MAEYLAFLRGINVGGNALIKMADLKRVLEEDGFGDVHTYIQSGNVFVTTPGRNKVNVAKKITKVIDTAFELDVASVVFSKSDWRKVVDSAPAWWGDDKDWKHNLLILLPPFKIKAVLDAIGPAVGDIEFLEGGTGVVYASTNFSKFGRSTMSKIVGKPVYKQMTVRNYNTSTKLLSLFC